MSPLSLKITNLKKTFHFSWESEECMKNSSNKFKLVLGCFHCDRSDPYRADDHSICIVQTQQVR